jgi:hypothetical protein
MGCIRDPEKFFPLDPDPGVKKAPDPRYVTQDFKRLLLLVLTWLVLGKRERSLKSGCTWSLNRRERMSSNLH